MRDAQFLRRFGEAGVEGPEWMAGELGGDEQLNVVPADAYKERISVRRDTDRSRPASFELCIAADDS